MWIWGVTSGFCLLGLIAILFLSGMVYQFISTKIDESAYPPPGKMVDIGGYRLHINSSGEGGPTVILDSGMGYNSLDWLSVQTEIAQFTRVCSYDRAGLGWSDKSPLDRTSENIVEELHTLLKNAGEKGPYILVGHSFGGINVRLYANRYPNDVIGIVLVDSSHENNDKYAIPEWPISFLTRLLLNPKVSPFLAFTGITRVLNRFNILLNHDVFFPPLQVFKTLPFNIQQMYRANLSTTKFFITVTNEGKTQQESARQLQNSQLFIRDKPVIVISAGKLDNVPEAIRDKFSIAWEAMQKNLVTQSTTGKYKIAEHSGHDITHEQPEIVVESVREMVLNEKNASDKPPRISLRELTKETVWDVMQLEPTDDQKKFVASNAASIAEAYFQKDYAWFRGIYSDNHPVGFVMIGMNPKDDFCFLWRFMIDKNHQNKGLGSGAIVCILEYLKSNTNYKSIVTSYVQGVGDPSSFYKKMGFVEADESVKTTELGKHIAEGGEVPLQLKFREGRAE